MVHELAYSLIAVILVSLISLVGILTFSIKQKYLEKLISVFVAFAAGALLGAAFFDLIPESFQAIGNINFVLLGLVLFFALESLIHWHHHHEAECKDCVKPVVYLALIGDGLHNFIDGIIIVSAFFIGIPSGIAVTFAIILHEIPQEIGDFSVLIHGGLGKSKAIFFNFLSALTSILGALIGFVFLNNFFWVSNYILAVAAGGFIYIAASDLFPELHKERDKRKLILQFIFLLLGIGIIWLGLG